MSRPRQLSKTLQAAAFGCAFGLVLPGLALAQDAGMKIGMRGLQNHDSSQPVEVTADQLTMEQEVGLATFEGNVLVVQGDLRLTADKVITRNRPEGSGIAHVTAHGNVVLITSLEAAEGDDAEYAVDSGALVMTGNVLLTQDTATIAGERLDADLRSGTGRMQGRVRTIFQPASGQATR